MTLRDRWNDLLPDADELADELAGRYTAADRRAYRDQYLEVALIALDSLEQLSTDPVAVRLAVWFHRAVHEPPTDDAEASAELAETLLPSYGVSPARIAEVARLVRLTSGTPDVQGDANAEVLLDAVNATYAGANYATHASEVRRESDDRSTAIKSRHTAVRELLDEPIYRTQIGRDRFDPAARANLGREFEILDAELPAPWRGWQRAVLITAAVFSPLLAALAAFGATDTSWRSPSGTDSAVLPGVLCGLALGTALLLYFFARRDDRTARLIGAAVALAALAGLIIAVVQVPEKTLSTGAGDRVPLLIISLVLLLLAGLASLAASWPVAPRPPVLNRGQWLGGVATVVVVIALTVFVADPIGRRYVLSANEHLTSTSTAGGAAVRSELDGQLAWVGRMTPGIGDTLRDAVGTRHGIAVARELGTIEMLDPATGEVRWRYSRSDSDERPNLYAVADGQLLVAYFEDVGDLVLDAATGRRKDTWPQGTRDHHIENADPLLTGEQVSKGSDKLRGVNLDGDARWTFKPGRCISISAAATADTAVAFLNSGCSDPDLVTGLDLKSGKKLWSHPATTTGQPSAVGGLVIWIERDGSRPGGTVVGVEARTGAVKWRWQLPSTWACTTTITKAGDQVVLLNCPTTAAKDTQTVATVLDGGTGGVVWQRTAPVRFSRNLEVTTDARVVTIPDPDGERCHLDVIEAAGYRQVPLPDAVVCRGGFSAIGTQVLVSGRKSVIALR
jgi:predicted metal-dependent HD superfamily phosphohydrolase/outer membrane protein assembly factor BamB